VQVVVELAGVGDVARWSFEQPNLRRQRVARRRQGTRRRDDDAYRRPPGDVPPGRLLPERRARDVVRAQPSPAVPLRRHGDAAARPAQGRRDPEGRRHGRPGPQPPSVVVWGVQPNETEPAPSLASRGRRPPRRPTRRARRRGRLSCRTGLSTCRISTPTTTTTQPRWPARSCRVSPSRSPVSRIWSSSASVRAPRAFTSSGGRSRRSVQQAQALLHALAHSQARAPGLTYAGLLG
jgi:hypothetical protein